MKKPNDHAEPTKVERFFLMTHVHSTVISDICCLLNYTGSKTKKNHISQTRLTSIHKQFVPLTMASAFTSQQQYYKLGVNYAGTYLVTYLKVEFVIYRDITISSPRF